MVMTVRRLAAHRALGLSVVAGADGLDRPITWAHAIELADPSPWLSGGELVMTTGLHLPDAAAGQRDYVGRLVRAGSAALAFDTGVRFSSVPTAIAAAADELGLPVLAVAPETPFIAISRAVIDDLTAEQVRVVRAVVAGQEKLARATMRGGITALVAALSRALESAVCVLDRTGLVLAEAGADGADLLIRVRDELHRDQRRRQAASGAVVDERGVLTIQQLPGSAEGEGHLAVASAAPLSPTDRMLVGHAVALLSIELAKPAKVVDAEQRLRKVVTSAVLDGDVPADAGLLRYFGFTPEALVIVVALTDVGPLLRAEEQLTAALEETAAPYLMTSLGHGDGVVFALDAQAGDDDLPGRLYAAVRTRLRRAVNGGVAEPVPIGKADLGLRQALSAARVGRVSGHTLVRFAELETFSLLLSTQPDEVLHAIAARWLDALEEHDRRHRTRLVASLEAFLHHNGHWESAAAELGVHRHTVRSRMDRVAEILGQDLDSAHTRSELWIALKARELLSLSVSRPDGGA
ncbi:MAG: PucR family transcriptional regulator [Actinobacteria bacterium]|nr:PucR family transcriptional regulator [Actinomycetota bacterium]